MIYRKYELMKVSLLIIKSYEHQWQSILVRDEAGKKKSSSGLRTDSK